MDPDVTYREMYECMRDGHEEEAREHAINLQVWLSKGGFFPRGYTEEAVRAYMYSVLRRTSHLTMAK